MDNMFILCLVIVLFAAGIKFGYDFMKKSEEERIDQVKNWLLFAVAIAERELGSGTGKLKLRYVYDMFLEKFPYATELIPFEAFSLMVDEALIELRKMIATNEKVKNFIEEGDM